ncbi:hypothetical protein QBZ16_004962 [Prototheca wickerhamii]|uniref:DNA polymerase n=1 Tax=Prototheca wickerhamii TaxID=3111 RepID=A0AAD9ML12_PROWI|nr:hypothetical protein QBZ16_004962 [Prototheca wickerhamii]
MDSDSSRGKRPAQGRVGSRAKQALAELAALRKSGAKRVDTFEVEEEKPVYDLVDEDQYAKIVKKRRDEGGAFVIDRNGLGYADIGEEVDWNRGESEEEEAAADKARPGAAGPRAQRAKMQRMFAAAAAKPRSRPLAADRGVDQTSTDELLAGILGNVAAAEPVVQAGSVAASRTPASVRSSVFSRLPRASIGSPPRLASEFAGAPEHHKDTLLDAGLAEDDVHEVTAADSSVDAPDEHDKAGSPGAAARAAPAHEPTALPATPAPALAPKATTEDCEPATQEAQTPMDAVTPGVNKVPGAAAPASVASWQTPAPALPAPPATPATDCPAQGWQRIYAETASQGAEAGDEAPGAEAMDTTPSGSFRPSGPSAGDDAELPLNGEGKLPFYLLDAHEELAQPGTVFLFGKVPTIPAPGEKPVHRSCCVVVRNLQRNLFFVPRDAPDVAALEEEVAAAAGDEAAAAAARRGLVSALHASLGALKDEVRELLRSLGVQSMTMKPVARRYAFENRAVAPGRHWVLKVRFPAAAGQAPVPVGASGRHFSAVFGSTQSALEALTLKRRLMGPGWLLVSEPRRVAASAQLSWCALEAEVDGHKRVAADAACAAPAPPLTLAALHVQTALEPGAAQAEIVAASVVAMPGVELDAAPQDAWRDARRLRHFSAVSKLGGAPFPPGFEAAVRAANASEAGRRNGGAALSAQPGERAALAGAPAPRALAGRRAGRRRRRARRRRRQPGALAVLAGRLLCDSYLAARELVREVDYTLGTLSRGLLGEARAEVSPGDVPSRFASADRLLGLLRLTESDAWLSLGLVFRLSVLPLTRALAALTGSSWARSLMSQRAQRIESLLLHEFYARKFLLPDKLTNKAREFVDDRAQLGDGEGVTTSRKGGKGPQYSGGLVLEPKVGLYDRYVLLLDFNSLYPSIIQEYNICFTTVARPETPDAAPALPPPSEELAVLPRVLQTLVQRRRAVKDLLRSERDAVRRAQLEIRQQALKLTANSMYGCLGFTHSRFYARPLAELVTAQGREVLQSTVDLVRGALGAEVIYGDTDSIMVHTGSADLDAVLKLGAALKREVNKRYRLLEIDIDGVYKRMLLLKKKKYAAIKIDLSKRGSDGAGAGLPPASLESVEQKGLDIVRRDWCPLAKDVGNGVLNEILSGKPREEVVAAVHAQLESVRAQLLGGAVPLHKFVITKQLTKAPRDYPDAQNQPHVQVALRRLAAGKRDGVAAGETVPYVICDAREGAVAPEHELAASEEAARTGDKSLAARAYHPQEVAGAEGGGDAAAPLKRLVPSVHYYLTSQVLPVVLRLCAPIEGTDAGRLAACLGLDPARYRGASAAAGPAAAAALEDALLGAGACLDDDDRFKSCDPLRLVASNGTAFALTSVRDLVSGKARVAAEAALQPPDAVGDAEEAWSSSDDPLMPYRSRNVCLRVREGSSVPGSNGPDPRSSATVHREISEMGLYTQLCHIHRCVDAEGALGTLGSDAEKVEQATKALAAIRPALDAAAKEALRFKQSNAHRWIKLDDLFAC